MSSVLDDNVIPPIIGSVMIAIASNKEDILNVLRKDVYAEEGAWDLDKVQIWPFRSSVWSKL